jgi:MFS family permease
VVVQHLLGSALGPPFIGALSDAYGLEIAMMLLPVFTFLAAVLFFVSSFFYDSDANKAEKVEIMMENISS